MNACKMRRIPSRLYLILPSLPIHGRTFNPPCACADSSVFPIFENRFWATFKRSVFVFLLQA